MNRRRFFGAIAAAPAAAKVAADQAVAELARAQLPGGAILGGSGGLYGGNAGVYGAPMAMQQFDGASAMRRLLSDPQALAEYRSLLFERNRTISQIDPDIACHRSFSLNAKIAFQRQRNVERELQEQEGGPWWHKFEALQKKFVGWLS
jgi:hypothetical protein